MFVVALAALALPASAAADPDAVVRDCASDGSVDGNYSDSDKRKALNRIPADLDEYSDCRSIIGASIGGPKAGSSKNDRDAGGGGGAAAAGGVAAKGVKAKKRKARAAKRKKRKTIEAALGDRNVDPRNSGVFQAADTSNGLPTPVLLALIALGLLAVAGAVMALGKRGPGLAATLRRVPLPFSRR